MEKCCFKCNLVKPLGEFYTHPGMADGHLNKCKDCTKADVKGRRSANPEKLKVYEKLRATMPNRIASINKYRKSTKGKEKVKRAQMTSRLRFPEKYKARNKFNNALRDGKVMAWPICAVPECNKEPEAHHPDYGQPLSVVWLCTRHHRQAHAASIT